MPVNRILSVSRTEIVVDGMLDEQMAQSIFMNITNGHPTISMQYGYSQQNNRTTIRFIPYRVYSVNMPPEVKVHVQTDISYERKIVIPGIVASYSNIIEKLWVPARKKAKRKDDNLKWVVVTPRIVKDEELKTVTTEISFFIEVYDERSHDPRGCKPESVKETLDRATDLIIEEIRKIILSDKGEVLEANYVMNDVSMAFAEALDTINQGDTPEES